MCERAVLEEPGTMDYFLYNCKTQGICKRAVEREKYAWEVFHDRYNTQEMCDKTVKEAWVIEIRSCSNLPQPTSKPNSQLYVLNCYIWLPKMWYEDCSHLKIPGT